MSFCARSSFLVQSSDWSSRSVLRLVVSSNCVCSACSLSSTSLSAAFFVASSADTSAYSPSAWASSARLGATCLATRSYTSIARTQQQRPYAALDALAIRVGSKSGLAVYLVILAMTSGLMLSLSYTWRLSRNLESFIIFLAGSQKSSTLPLPSGAATLTGRTSFMMHTASIVSLTPAGGDFMFFTSVTSSFFSVLSAFTAASSAGSASASPASQSSLIAIASFALTSAAADSFSTTSRVACASAESRSMTTISSSASRRATTSLGCSSVSSACMPATDSAVCVSFSRPTS
mmetsp:Transcript_34026/g.93488  ORF Transcript_34026/g.93488 Transcript_34026/m.93488 type:complete len:291 (+) Transcript_34026:532-1404(+)